MQICLSPLPHESLDVPNNRVWRTDDCSAKDCQNDSSAGRKKSSPYEAARDEGDHHKDYGQCKGFQVRDVHARVVTPRRVSSIFRGTGVGISFVLIEIHHQRLNKSSVSVKSK